MPGNSEIKVKGSEYKVQGNSSSMDQGFYPDCFAELERGVYAALETYSNVHRGSGHNSMVSTWLFEQARDIVLEYLGLDKGKYTVIFCTPLSSEILKTQLQPGTYKCLSSQEIDLSLGVRALAVVRKKLPKGTPRQTGGGTTRVVSPGWVVWAEAPGKFEAGTPAIVNVIAFARALQMIRYFGNNTFQHANIKKMSALEILYHDELQEFSGRKLFDELRETLIGKNIVVPTQEGSIRYINLDNGASTPTFMPVWKTVCQAWCQPAEVQQDIIHEVKSICATVLGASLASYDIIFTSNTTESINLTAESLSSGSEKGIDSVVVNTLLEHNSNELPWRMLNHVSLIRMQVDAEGFLDLNELDALLSAYNQKGQHGKKQIKLVAVTGASNVLGILNNLMEICQIVHRYGARLLVDAAQLVAHRKIEMERCGIDYLAFSAHKVYAPFGCGVLVVRKGLFNFSHDGMDLIQSSGEENVAGIAALGKSLMLLQRIGFDLIRDEEQVLTKRALTGLSKIEGLTIYGIKDPESPRFAQKGGVIVFSVKGMMADRVAKELAEVYGIGIRSGCHCAHLLVKRLVNLSPLLERFQRVILTLFPKIALPGVARVSLGIGNSEEDIDRLIIAMGRIAGKARTRVHKYSSHTPVRTTIQQERNASQQINDFIRAAAQRVYYQL
jgi:selenocysteine lyase/cysteine desulfurase